MTKRKGFRRLKPADKLRLSEARKKALALRGPTLKKKPPLPPTKPKEPKVHRPPRIREVFDLERSQRCKKICLERRMKKDSKRAAFLERMQLAKEAKRKALQSLHDSNQTPEESDGILNQSTLTN